MPPAVLLSPPTHALPETLPPKKTFRFLDVQSDQVSATTQPYREPEHRVPHATTPSIQLQLTTDHDSESQPIAPRSEEEEEEYTLSAYGDISLSDIIVPPLPPPTRPDHMWPKIPHPQPRLRLRVQRPPMPTRRVASSVPAPKPRTHSGGLKPDEGRPGSPKSPTNRSPCPQHQLSPPPKSSWTQESKPAEKGCSSLEKIFDKLLPRPPSIRLSPPGSPASQVLSLPQETHGRGNGVQRQGNTLNVDDEAKHPQSPPAAAPQQEKPWRTRLPPRPPIPKWDI